MTTENHIIILAFLVFDIEEGGIFAIKILHLVIHHIYQGTLPQTLPIEPEGEVPQHGIQLIQGVLPHELGELTTQMGRFEWPLSSPPPSSSPLSASNMCMMVQHPALRL